MLLITNSKTLLADTFPWSTAQGEIVMATSPSFYSEAVALSGVRLQFKESKGEDTCKKGKMMEKSLIGKNLFIET